MHKLTPTNNQHPKNQIGFVVIELVLVFILLGIIGYTGYRVYQVKQQSEIPTKTQPTVQPEVSEPAEPTADWKTYTSQAGKYSLKHPTEWFEDVCDEQATDLTLNLGTSAEARVDCEAEMPISQILVVSTPAVPTESEQDLDTEYYKDKTSEEVTVDGIKGERQSGKLKNAELGAPAGTLIVRYFFLAPTRSYIAAYVQMPDGDYSADKLEEFDLMIQETMNFAD